MNAELLKELYEFRIGLRLPPGDVITRAMQEIERLSAYSMHERSLGADAGAIAGFDAGWNAALLESIAIAKSEDGNCEHCSTAMHIALNINGLIAREEREERE